VSSGSWEELESDLRQQSPGRPVFRVTGKQAAAYSMETEAAVHDPKEESVGRMRFK